jgi:predicted Zn-dependent protease
MKQSLSRRDFLYMSGICALGAATGCAKNPVTGEQQFMLLSKSSEIQLDKERSPLQFSNDYGPTDDAALNAYLSETGKSMAQYTHRPDMPYSFRCVDAVYVNAYAFPGGSIACTRGILLTLEDEAELAALLGHEMGHVNARHSASRMSKGMAVSLLSSGLAAYAASFGKGYGEIAAGMGGIASGALLAFYSREDERQADALGMEYMTRSGYSPKGMVGLQQHLVDLHDSKPSATELLFASHPMSEERLETAKEEMRYNYAKATSNPVYRDRYMDNTAALRAKKDGIEKLQTGAKYMVKKDFTEAGSHFSAALKQIPDDYAGNLMMAKCQLAQGREAEAKRYADAAHSIKPTEPQADQVIGLASLTQNDYPSALRAFHAYEKALPGNPSTAFYKGLALEGMGDRSAAAWEYNRYITATGGQGQRANWAASKLDDWGYAPGR